MGVGGHTRLGRDTRARGPCLGRESNEKSLKVSSVAHSRAKEKQNHQLLDAQKKKKKRQKGRKGSGWVRASDG